MRPERIVVEGFGTFRDRAEIDFDGVDMFALTGPTGSGKSTIIDAIVFALYGVVPRLDDKKLVGPVISQDRVEARVQLDFSVGDARYTAVRVVKETASKAKRATATVGLRAGTTKEARLERRVSHDESEVLAGTADELTAEVERLLGLSFEHFTTCVVLPQGQFARFLHHKPRFRQDLLVELLDLGVYGDMASLARGREKEAQGSLDWLARELEGLSFATPEAASRCRARVESFEAVIADIDAVQPEIDSIAMGIRDLESQHAEAEECIQRLRALSAPAGVDELAEEAASAAEASAVAAAEAERSSATAAAADGRREALGDRTALELILRDVQQRAATGDKVARGEAAAREAEENQAAAQAGANEARAALENALASLEEARVAHRAADLAGYLVEGETCPVCGNEVHELPVHEAPALTLAEQSEARARRAREEEEGRLSEVAAHLRRVVDSLAEKRLEMDALDKRLENAPDAETIREQLDVIEAADAVLKQARVDEREARSELAGADKRRKLADERSADAWRAFDEGRDRVALLAPPPAERSDLRSAWQSLVEWAGTERSRYVTEAGSIAAEIAELRARRSTMEAGVAASCECAGLDPAGRSPRDAAVEALADARTDVVSIDQALARVAELKEQTAALTARQEVARELGRHLGATGFEKWVLDEALERLVAGATEMLMELSGNAYSLVIDPKTSNFFVRDHKNANALRSARTLSGGETFLASLALALALADQVAEMAAAGAVRLESIFLDEGFGTLDPDTLETVATAIEELGSRGRLVGLVSHVSELADRMPVRFVVSKTASTSTVERIEA